MPWKEETLMSLRVDLVARASEDDANVSQLCRTFGISRKTAYKWLGRYAAVGVAGLEDLSRRPHHSPHQTREAIEALVLQAREEHPCWGSRKLRAWLLGQGYVELPCPSTLTAILRRHDCLDPAESLKHTPFQRFEREQPNQLWQMDFKGYFLFADGSCCHPLSVLDDHSRFLLGLKACPAQSILLVQEHLTFIFRQYGLPERLLMDNGTCWRGEDTPYTWLIAWLLRLSIAVSHGRPHHPQTQGKVERFHRTLEAELLHREGLTDLATCQAQFEQWRTMYNTQRPHEALDLQAPASRYQPSPRPFPESLPPILYPAGDSVRKVDASGRVSYRNRGCYVGKGFRGYPVAIRPTEEDGVFDVFFCAQRVASIDLREHNHAA